MPASKEPAKPTTLPRLDDSLEHLLLGLSAACAQGRPVADLITLFCRESRKLFALDGVYYWKVERPNRLVSLAADGHLADKFLTTNLTLSDPAVAVEAVKAGHTVYVNHIDPKKYPLASAFHAAALMVAPLLVGGEALGAAVFLSRDSPACFNEEVAAKATILAAQLASLMANARLSAGSREERRRAEVLVQCAQSLHAVLDVHTVINALTERICEVFQVPIATVMVREQEALEMRGAAAATPELLAAVRRTHAEHGCKAAAKLVEQVAESDQVVCVRVEPGNKEFPEFITTGEMFAAPLRTTRTSGALLVYSGPERSFSEQERSLIAAIARFGALALSNAELLATVNARAFETQQLLEISSTLGSLRDLDRFLEQFVVRAASFLGFARCFVGLVEGGDCCRVRWGATGGQAQPVNVKLSSQRTRRILESREPFWTEDATQDPDGNPENVGQFGIRQYLAVPLVGSDARVLGLFGLLDKIDGRPIRAEDVRRAKALGAPAAVALEATQNLQRSERHRRRAEDLMALALELSASLRLPDFARSFAQRAAEMLGARAAALALSQGSALETIVLHDPGASTDKSQLRRLNAAFTDLATGPHGALFQGDAAELLGPGIATAFGWKEVVVVRLTGADNDPLGLLCLANVGRELSDADRNLLQAISGHAAVALENSRLFSRIAQSNKHWAEIFDSITDLLVVHDETHRVLRVNQPLAHFIGVRPAELIGLGMSALVALGAEGGGQPCPFCRPGMETSDEYIHTVMERTYLVSTSRVRAALNEGLQTIHVLKDISDRREAERRYRELLDNIQEGIFFSTPDGRFVEVNDALVRMLGYSSREELLQVDIRNELYPVPQYRERFTGALDQHGVVRNFEETLRRKDGSMVHTLQNAFAVRDARGAVTQYRGVMLDITEVKAFQAQLQRERDFNTSILNNTQSMILVADTAGLVSYANRRCFEHGNFRESELLGHRLIDFVASPRREAMAAAFDAVLAGQPVDNLELPMVRTDGKLSQFSINLSPMRDGRGDVNSIVAVMTDITDAAMLQGKLIHAEKMAAVGQLVSGVAHEVNNPLTAILGFADLLLEQEDVPESARKNLNVIVQEAQRTKMIVQNLLSFARQMPAERRPVRVNPILRQTLQLRAYDFASHGVDIVERLSEEIPDVVGDAQQLQQVFLNIINNAYDAVRGSERRGAIEVETSCSHGGVEILFRDNGAGIQFPERIFDPFFTTKEVGKGTGLGLSICYGIVREHGGDITCHNNQGRPGASFVVRLPAVGYPARVPAATAGAKA